MDDQHISCAFVSESGEAVVKKFISLSHGAFASESGDAVLKKFNTIYQLISHAFASESGDAVLKKFNQLISRAFRGCCFEEVLFYSLNIVCTHIKILPKNLEKRIK